MAKDVPQWPLSKVLQSNETALQEFANNMMTVEDTDKDGKISYTEFSAKDEVKHDEL